jgi:hypothetical protein
MALFDAGLFTVVERARATLKQPLLIDSIVK